MLEPLTSCLTRSVRWTLAVITAVLVVASFSWVLLRPLFYERALGDRIEITVLHHGGKEEDAIVAQMCRDFEALHPDIRIKRINAGIWFLRKRQTMFAAGCPADVFYLGNNDVTKYAGNGLLLPLDDFIATDRAAGRDDVVLEDFYPEVLDGYRFDGEQIGRGPLYGLPKDFTTVVFYYNRELFRRANVPYPGSGWTWEDFLHAARAIGQLEDCYGAELVVWPMMVRAYLRSCGADIAAADFRTYELDDPAVADVLERIRAWRFDGTRTIKTARSQVELGEDLFLAGRVGIYGALGRWMVPRFRQVPDLEFDVAPIPRGTQPANLIVSTSWAIASTTPYPRAAWEVVRFFSGPPGHRLNATSGLSIPATRSVARSEAFLDPEQRPRHDEVFLDVLAHAEYDVWPPDERYESTARTEFDACLKYNHKSAPAALAAIEEEWCRLDDSLLKRTDYPPAPWSRIALFVGVPLGLALLIAAWFWWRHRPGRMAFREELAGMAFASPWFVGFIVITAFPIVLSLLLAFTRWFGILTLDEADWVGWANFRELLFEDRLFHQSLFVTVLYAALAVPLTQLAALGAAILMNREIAGIGFFRSAWYLPSVLAGVGMAVLWKWVFDGEHGLLNQALGGMLHVVNAGSANLAEAGLIDAAWSLTPPDWLGDDAGWYGPPAFALMGLWSVGGSMMIYLAGLNGIPDTLYEAAEIDGAGRLRRFRNVTLPMLSPVIFFNGIMAIIASFQVFTQAFVMTNGGPENKTLFYVLYLYRQAFEFHQMGYASAMAWLLLLLILALTLVVMRGSSRFVYYEGLRA